MDLEWMEFDTLDRIKKMIDKYDNIICSFSGGKDSTILRHLIKRVDTDNKVKFVFSNTMMELNATYEFIKKFDDVITIQPVKPAPLVYRDEGKPLGSKYISDMISRLQKHNFDFVNDTFKSFEELIIKYPNCKGGLKWLCGKNITLNCPKYLRKLLPTLTTKVSNKCCYYLKKLPVKKYIKENKIDLNIIGVRKAEGGLENTRTSLVY